MSLNDADPTGQVITNAGLYSGQGCVPTVPMLFCVTNPTSNSVLDIIMTGRAYGLSATITLLETSPVDFTQYAYPHIALGPLNGLQWA